MPCYHLRVDYKSPEDLEKGLQFVKDQLSVDSIIALEKKTTNQKEHFHAQFWTDTILSTLRQQFHVAMLPSVYEGRIKKEYCLKIVPDHELYDSEKYMCKGENALTPPNLYLQTGKYTIEKTIELHAEWYRFGGPRAKGNGTPLLASGDVQTQHETVIHHRIEKVVKPKKNFYNDVIDYLHRQYPDREWTLRDTPIMLTAILKLHGKLFRPYGPQQLENEMNVIMNILCFDEHHNNMYEQVRLRGNIPHLRPITI